VRGGNDLSISLFLSLLSARTLESVTRIGCDEGFRRLSFPASEDASPENPGRHRGGDDKRSPSSPGREIPDLLSLGSLPARAGFPRICRRLEPSRGLRNVSRAVSPFRSTIAASATFCPPTGWREESGKSSMPLLHRRRQWGESIPSCSALAHPPTATFRPPRLVFRHLSTPPVISSCRYLKHGSHPDNAGIPFSTTTTTTVDATLHRCCCHRVASNSIRRRDRALACGREGAEKAPRRCRV